MCYVSSCIVVFVSHLYLRSSLPLQCTMIAGFAMEIIPPALSYPANALPASISIAVTFAAETEPLAKIARATFPLFSSTMVAEFVTETTNLVEIVSEWYVFSLHTSIYLNPSPSIPIYLSFRTIYLLFVSLSFSLWLFNTNMSLQSINL